MPDAFMKSLYEYRLAECLYFRQTGTNLTVFAAMGRLFDNKTTV